MAIDSKAFREGDVYIDFPFEQVMFHCFKGVGGKILRRFYGECKESTVPYTSDLFREAQRFGVQITAEQYAAGKAAVK